MPKHRYVGKWQIYGHWQWVGLLIRMETLSVLDATIGSTGQIVVV